jgi:hypothetical protein
MRIVLPAAVVVAVWTHCRREATENYCFCCCSSSQTIGPNSVGCGKLECDFEMKRKEVLRDFVGEAVAEATRVSCVAFAVEIGEAARVAAVVLRSSGDNLREA